MMHNKISYVKNYHYEKLKQKIVLTFRHLKMSNLFPSISSTRAFGSLFWAGARHLYLVRFPQGSSIESPPPLSIYVALCCESICMKYMDQSVNQNVNLVLIGQHSH